MITTQHEKRVRLGQLVAEHCQSHLNRETTTVCKITYGLVLNLRRTIEQIGR